MKKLIAIGAVALLGWVNTAAAADPELKTDDDKVIYTLGVALSRSIAQFGLSASELELVKMGLTDGALNKDKKVNVDEFQPKIQQLSQARMQKAAEAEKKASQAFLDKAAKEKGAKKTASGLIYQELKAGSGDSPAATDKVKVHYHGTTIDGTVFDSSVQRGQPATFPLNGVVKCWTEGVQLMKVGGKGKLICPSDLAYGDRGSPPKIKPGATLIFEVELLEIVKPEAAPAAPQADPKAPPPAH